MYSNIISRIRTKSETKILVDEIDVLLQSLYQDHGGAFEETLEKEVRNWVKEELEKAFQKSQNKTKVLEELKKKIDGMEFLKLNIAFEPTSANLDKFRKFAKENVSEDVVLDIEYNPEAIGGAQVSYKGEYRDFSIKKRFQENRSEIEKMINAVLNSRGKDQIE